MFISLNIFFQQQQSMTFYLNFSSNLSCAKWANDLGLILAKDPMAQIEPTT